MLIMQIQDSKGKDRLKQCKQWILSKAYGLLDEQPKVFIPAALIIGYMQETMNVSCHTLPDSFEWKINRKWPKQQKQED